MSRFRALPFGMAGAVLFGCAKPYSPPGGEPDTAPPRVIATTPERMAVVPGFDGPVVFRFDERISERGIEQAVLVSPETGAVELDKGRSDLSVSIEGGWKPDQIYRIVIRPVIRDLFGNTMEQPIDLIFSTGPPIPATALAGVVTDRITGEAAAQARVEAVRRADSTVYVAVADTGGVFALRHIPAGAYDLRAYLDTRPNTEPDFTEPIDTGAVALGTTDTVVTTFSLLAPDTTSARLLRAEVEDSLAIRLMLDDYLDPTDALDGVRVTLRSLPDSDVVDVAEVIHAYVYERRVAAARAAADSARAAAADSLAAEEAIATDAARAVESVAVDTLAVDTTAAADTAGAVDSGARPDSVAALDSVAAPRLPGPDSIPRPVAPAAGDSAAAPDSAAAAVADTVLGAVRADTAAGAAGDSAAADTSEIPTLAGDSLPPEPSGGAGAAEDAEARGGVAADTLPEPLPSRELIVVPVEPLEPGVSFIVVLEGVRNIAGVVGGGGSAKFAVPVRPPTTDTTSAAADTTSAAADTTSAAADTTGAAADTTGAAADTTGAAQNTTGAAQDAPASVRDATDSEGATRHPAAAADWFAGDADGRVAVVEAGAGPGAGGGVVGCAAGGGWSGCRITSDTRTAAASASRAAARSEPAEEMLWPPDRRRAVGQ
ncbi:MAG TPA: Ig-like domain-containing protein [Longimicrobiales bacterium]